MNNINKKRWPLILIDEPGKKEMRDFIEDANLSPEITDEQVVFDTATYEIKRYGAVSTYFRVSGERSYIA